MVKREATANIDFNGPRPKRRKDTDSVEPTTDDVEIGDAGASSDQDGEAEDAVDDVEMSPEEIAELGQNVWDTVKNAVSKDNRSLSYDFLRLPSKRQYPDYYQVIAKPIALEDIKTKLDNKTYTSLESLRQDFEFCFKNAKKYNMRESQIWRDAKTLQKIANKEIERLRGRNGDGDGSDEEGGRKKKKGSNVYRLMKNRLQKLVAMKSDDGRVLSNPFMELPSRKLWAVYYKVIKRPICIEDIFKKIKRKEYAQLPDFIDDVELVFANATNFNEAGSQIYEDAILLREYFHKIMSDIPSKYTIDGDAKEQTITNKIVLKVPQHLSVVTQPSHTGANGIEEAPIAGSSGSVRLRIPGVSGLSEKDKPPPPASNAVQFKHTKTNSNEIKASVSKSPVLRTVPVPATPNATSVHQANNTGAPPVKSTTKAPSIPAQTPVSHQATPTPTSASTPSVPTTFSTFSGNLYTPQSYYPASNASKQAQIQQPPLPATVTPSTSASASLTMPRRTTPSVAASTSGNALPTASTSGHGTPVPPASAAGIRSVRIVTQPLGRHLDLTSDEGVRNWSMRLGGGETKLLIRNIRFAGVDEGSDASDEEGRDDDESFEAETPKKRGRGRPRKSKVVKQKPTISPVRSLRMARHKHSSSSVSATLDDVVVKLDSAQVNSNTTEEWDVEVGVGRHTLEIGKKGNPVVWKMYLERLSY